MHFCQRLYDFVNLTFLKISLPLRLKWIKCSAFLHLSIFTQKKYLKCNINKSTSIY